MRRMYMDRRERTRQQMRRERRVGLAYLAAMIGLVILGKCFWDALLAALALLLVKTAALLRGRKAGKIAS